jgi:hypothetical protein
MRKQLTIFFAVLFSLVLGTITGSTQVSNREDNPNLDQIPYYILQTIPINTDAPLSSVITINNWDNFNLGVDFAENNMANHPGQPTWFFTAYNTNGTHHTENGFDWYINNPVFGTSVAGDPVCAYDSLGNLFYENMYPSGTIQGCKVVKSTNNGAAWNPSVTAISGIDKNWITADQTAGPYANYVYTTMTANSGGNFARSIDHGISFSSTFQPSTQSLPGMMPCVGPNGNIQGGSVYVVTNGGSTFASTYTFYRSLDGGTTFTQMSSQQFAGYVGTNVGNRHSVQGMRTRPYPFIAADNSYGPHRGRLYCVHASNDPPGNGNKPDIWLRYSDNGGTSWSSAQRVNDDPNPTQHHQWHPAIWCDKWSGRLYIQWMDTRDTPTNDSAFIYATYTDDGGNTFATNQRISNKKMKIDCPSCGGGGTPRYQGDYNGIVSNKKTSMLGWTDFRNGNFLSATAYFPDFALSIDHNIDTLYTPSDSTIFYISVPEVKLYTDTVIVSAEINPVPSTGSITFLFPSGNIMTSYPDSLPVRVILQGDVPLGSYQGLFYAKGPNGTPIHRRTATIKVLEWAGFIVVASAMPDTICQGQTSQLNTNIMGGYSPFTYSWSPTTGLSNPNIANPEATPMQTTIYHVLVTDAFMNTAEDSVKIYVKTAPNTPGPITGNQEVCKDSISGYSVNEVVGATSYSWTVPADAIIVNGQNTPSIAVKWGQTSGNVSVIAGNECGNSNPSVLTVSVKMVPDTPGLISGSDTTCEGLNYDFSISDVSGATEYLWEVPADAIITSGQGTNSITVQWGGLEGDISVIAGNLCGYSPPRLKTIILGTIPEPAGIITGKDTVCLNQGNYQFSVPVIAYATSYVWAIPPGVEITSGLGTREIELYFSTQAQNGTISVFGSSICGNGESSSKDIIVHSCAGIEKKDLSSCVKLYPNPTSGKLIISYTCMEKEMNLTLTDIEGRQIYFEHINMYPGKFMKEIDLTACHDGIYFVFITVNDELFKDKLVIRKNN